MRPEISFSGPWIHFFFNFSNCCRHIDSISRTFQSNFSKFWAFCKRTLNVIKTLSVKHSEKIRFYLSKADEAGHESDRQRVMMQIVQELCKRPGLNRTGFDMPTIYIPNPNKQVRCVNQIDDVCRDIEKTINQTIQVSVFIFFYYIMRSSYKFIFLLWYIRDHSSITSSMG